MEIITFSLGEALEVSETTIWVLDEPKTYIFFLKKSIVFDQNVNAKSTQNIYKKMYLGCNGGVRDHWVLMWFRLLWNIFKIGRSFFSFCRSLFWFGVCFLRFCWPGRCFFLLVICFHHLLLLLLQRENLTIFFFLKLDKFVFWPFVDQSFF